MEYGSAGGILEGLLILPSAAGLLFLTLKTSHKGVLKTCPVLLQGLYIARRGAIPWQQLGGKQEAESILQQVLFDFVINP